MKSRVEERLVAMLFILPSLIGFTVFYVLPAVRGIVISFTDWDLLTEQRYVGASNYRDLVTDEAFWNSLRVTVAYVAWNIPLQTVLGLALALTMRAFSLRPVARGLFLIPWLLPTIVVGLIWLWILDPSVGVVNALLRRVGGSMVPFLTSVRLALPSVAGINIWRFTGYTALLFYAGLQTVDPRLYEAATIDGAGPWQRFANVTLPLLRPVTAFVVVTSVLGSFQVFDVVAITTKGGPVSSTKVLNWVIYETAFQRFRMGYASAVAMVMFVMLVGVALVQMRLFGGWEAEQ